MINYLPGKEKTFADLLSRPEINNLEVRKEDEEVITRAHEAKGHGGRDATYLFARERLSFPGMYKIAEKVVEKCETCRKARKEKKYKIHPSKMGEIFDKIGIDLIGPIRKSNSGMKYIILATDYTSRYVEAKSVRTKSAAEVAKFLTNEIFLRHGVPKEIKCDQGTEFKNNLVKLICRYWQTKLSFSTPYHPEANGKVERTNRTGIIKLAKHLQERLEYWNKELKVVKLLYNITPIEKMKMSPYEIFYGKKIRIPLGIMEVV